MTCHLTVFPYLSLACPRAAVKPAIMALASSLSVMNLGLMWAVECWITSWAWGEVCACERLDTASDYFD